MDIVLLPYLESIVTRCACGDTRSERPELQHFHASQRCAGEKTDVTSFTQHVLCAGMPKPTWPWPNNVTSGRTR